MNTKTPDHILEIQKRVIKRIGTGAATAREIAASLFVSDLNGAMGSASYTAARHLRQLKVEGYVQPLVDGRSPLQWTLTPKGYARWATGVL